MLGKKEKNQIVIFPVAEEATVNKHPPGISSHVACTLSKACTLSCGGHWLCLRTVCNILHMMDRPYE